MDGKTMSLACHIPLYSHVFGSNAITSSIDSYMKSRYDDVLEVSAAAGDKNKKWLVLRIWEQERYAQQLKKQ